MNDDELTAEIVDTLNEWAWHLALEEWDNISELMLYSLELMLRPEGTLCPVCFERYR